MDVLLQTSEAAMGHVSRVTGRTVVVPLNGRITKAELYVPLAAAHPSMVTAQGLAVHARRNPEIPPLKYDVKNV